MKSLNPSITRYTSLFLVCLGIALILYGFGYNLFHLDDALDGHTNILLENASSIGFIAIIAAQLLRLRYKIAIILLGVLIAFEIWAHLGS